MNELIAKNNLQVLWHHSNDILTVKGEKLGYIFRWNYIGRIISRITGWTDTETYKIDRVTFNTFQLAEKNRYLNLSACVYDTWIKDYIGSCGEVPWKQVLTLLQDTHPYWWGDAYKRPWKGDE